MCLGRASGYAFVLFHALFGYHVPWCIRTFTGVLYVNFHSYQFTADLFFFPTGFPETTAYVGLFGPSILDPKPKSET